MAEFSSLNGYMVKDATARNIAKGRNQAVAFSDYATMIAALNAMEKSEYKTGQNIYIGVVGVPDLWVYSVENIVHDFSYVSDEDVVEKLTANTTIQAGYYKLAMLEGQKVDLTTVNEAIAEINDKLVEHEASFQDGCSTVAATITEMGVPTADNASPEEMSANIRKLKRLAMLGTVSNTSTFGISVKDYDGYENFTLSNFLISSTVQVVSQKFTEKVTCTSNITPSYDASTGNFSLTVRGTGTNGNGTDAYKGTFDVYLVY